MFGMALTRPRHWQMAWTSSRMCAGKRQTSINNIQPHDKRVSVFVKCVTIFRLFFWKLPQFHTSNFRKVVRQHTEGMVGSTTFVLLEIYLAFQEWKNFENPLRIDKVIAMSSVCSFFGPPGIYIHRVAGVHSVGINDASWSSYLLTDNVVTPRFSQTFI